MIKLHLWLISLFILSLTTKAEPIVNYGSGTYVSSSHTLKPIAPITDVNFAQATIEGLNLYALFGDGSDGAIVLDGTNTFSFFSKSGNVYTATRPIYATNITVNSGITWQTNGYRFFWTGTLSGAGTFSNAGTNGGNASGQTGGSSGAGGTANQLGGGGNGGAGASGNGTSGGAGVGGNSQAGGNGETAGNGGANGSTAGGTGGAAGTATNKAIRQVPDQIVLGTAALIGGAGGGGGACGEAAVLTATNGCGGGGGGGGGVIDAWGSVINFTGVWLLTGGNGGNGANGTSSNSGGGGAGAPGGGGSLRLVRGTSTSDGTVTNSAGSCGTFGTPSGSGGSGTTCTGTATGGSVIKFNATTHSFN